MATNVKVWREVRLPVQDNQWQLCFQDCVYNYDDGGSEAGFRFIWRRPNGNLQAARGQARLPSADAVRTLLKLAEDAGWF